MSPFLPPPPPSILSSSPSPGQILSATQEQIAESYYPEYFINLVQGQLQTRQASSIYDDSYLGECTRGRKLQGRPSGAPVLAHPLASLLPLCHALCKLAMKWWGRDWKMGQGRLVPKAGIITPSHPLPQVTLWLWVNSVAMTQKVSVSPGWGQGRGWVETQGLGYVPFLSDSPFTTFSPQLSLLFADFVAGVPKGNLTYGYVRPRLTLPSSLPIPSPD